MGAGGMLGRDLVEVFGQDEVTPFTRDAMDVTDREATRAALSGFDVVVNAAAFTRVDDAEDREADAFAVNAHGAGNVAAAARATGAKVVYISTDYVFDGSRDDPYVESAEHSPRSAYGRTKAAGERATVAENPERALIVRTAWLYGAHGGNFVRTMLTLARTRDVLHVVDDQRGQPTWSLDLAQQVRALLGTGTDAGIYHGTNSGMTTWFGLARAAFELAGLDPERIRPVSSAKFPRRAPRPAFSVLGHRAWADVGLEPLRPWRDALDEAFRDGVFDEALRG